eukprot:926856_1
MPPTTPHYAVEQIVGHRSISGSLLYLVKWQGFPASDNTWEPLSSFFTCQDLILEYRQANSLSPIKKKSSSAEEKQEEKQEEEKEEKQEVEEEEMKHDTVSPNPNTSESSMGVMNHADPSPKSNSAGTQPIENPDSIRQSVAHSNPNPNPGGASNPNPGAASNPNSVETVEISNPLGAVVSPPVANGPGVGAEKEKPPLEKPNNETSPVKIGGKDHYIVESIVGDRQIGRRIEYLVKWHGYPSEENTWQSSNSLKRVPEMLKEYKTKMVGKSGPVKKTTPRKRPHTSPSSSLSSSTLPKRRKVPVMSAAPRASPSSAVVRAAKSKKENKKRKTPRAFEAESISGYRSRPSGPEYFVKWKGFPASQNTWEPLQNVSGCVDLTEPLKRKFLSDLKKFGK